MTDFSRESATFSKCVDPSARMAFSLLELLVVLVILIATALIAIPTFRNIEVAVPGGTTESPESVVTMTTLLAVRDAIVGQHGVIQSLAHRPGAIPTRVIDLVKEQPPASLEAAAPELKEYNPFIQIGWRGPYVHATGTAITGEPTVVDGWGTELELQIDFDEDGQVSDEEARYARIVSAGPNGLLDTPKDVSNMRAGSDSLTELTLVECEDDLVVFLNVPDERK